jgi:hypothetical protein
MQPLVRWRPNNLGGNSSSAGGQNGTRYAFFSDQRRLAVDRGDGDICVYDTGDHLISGVPQNQGNRGREVAFRGQHGEVALNKLKHI